MSYHQSAFVCYFEDIVSSHDEQCTLELCTPEMPGIFVLWNQFIFKIVKEQQSHLTVHAITKIPYPMKSSNRMVEQNQITLTINITSSILFQSRRQIVFESLNVLPVPVIHQFPDKHKKSAETLTVGARSPPKSMIPAISEKQVA